MSKKRGLGKGLDALLGGLKDIQDTAVAVIDDEAQTPRGPSGAALAPNELRKLPVEQLQRGRYQPRREFDEEKLEELASSIRAQGLMQPIIVRPVGHNRYEIIAGERRWRAAQKAGLEVIPALVRDIPDDAAIAMALIENIQREDLNPMEEALGLQRLIDEFGLTHQQVADAVGKSRTTVTNLLRLNHLAHEVKTLLEHGDIEMGHARALLALDNELQTRAARAVVGKGLSVRQTEAMVRKLQSGDVEKPAAPATDPNVRRLQLDIAEKIGAAVEIQHNDKGRGTLVIKYNSLDELDGILAHIH